MNFLQATFALFLKDLRMELRARESVNSLVVFALLVVVVFNFAITPGTVEPQLLIPGVVWITVAFSGVLAFSRVFQVEEEDEALMGLLVAPVDRSFIFLAKFLYVFLILVAVEAILFPVTYALYNPVITPRYPALFLAILLADVGLAGAGVIQGAIGTRTRAREIMIPLLFFPLIVPLLLGAVRLTSAYLFGTQEAGGWLVILALFDFLFLALGALLFEHLLEE